MAAVVGDARVIEGSQNSVEIENLARFAVQEHNKKEVSPFFLIKNSQFIWILIFIFLLISQENSMNKVNFTAFFFLSTNIIN